MERKKEEEKVEAVIHQLDCTICRGNPTPIMSDFSNICNQHLAEIEKTHNWREGTFIYYKNLIDELSRRGITRRPE